MSKKIEIEISELRQMAQILWEAYEAEGEDYYLEIPMKLGLIEYRPVTAEEIKNHDDYTEDEPGDMWYFVLTEKEIEKKYERENMQKRFRSKNKEEVHYFKTSNRL